MRFKVDENLPVEAADVLRQAGHDAVTVLEQGHAGSADAHLAVVCQRESRALVTLDMDFADIRAYPPADFPGLVVFRLWRQDKALCAGCAGASASGPSRRAIGWDFVDRGGESDPDPGIAGVATAIGASP